MKNKIKWMIFGAAIIIFVITILLILNKNKVISEEIDESELLESETEKFYPVKNETDYFKIKSIVDRYIQNIQNLNGDSYIDDNMLRIGRDETIKLTKDEAIKALMGMIEKNNKTDVDINEEFFINQAKKYVIQGDYKKSNVVYNIKIKEMYEYKYNDRISLFLFLSTIKENQLNLLIKYDNVNNTFSLLIYDNIEKNNQNLDVNSLDISYTNIEENMYNKIIIDEITDEEMSKEYFNIQKNNLINDMETEYEKLDSQYKENKYTDYNDFKNYYSNLKSQLINSKLDKYGIDDKNGKKIYTLIDNYGNYYIIEVGKSINDYTVKLDNYTVETESFKDTYNDASDQRKVALNITKINTALNNQDYKYVYSKLADSFKNNYFENEDKLREYIITNLYKKSTLEFEDFSREGNYFTYKIRVIKEYEDGEEIPFGKNEPSKNVNIVMQLKEGTDFVMSFSIDE